ncbi:hypothetical protein FB451DRAFT_1442366, partial [Mycena latifolia]
MAPTCLITLVLLPFANALSRIPQTTTTRGADDADIRPDRHRGEAPASAAYAVAPFACDYDQLEGEDGGEDVAAHDARRGRPGALHAHRATRSGRIGGPRACARQRGALGARVRGGARRAGGSHGKGAVTCAAEEEGGERDGEDGYRSGWRGQGREREHRCPDPAPRARRCALPFFLSTDAPHAVRRPLPRRRRPC